MKKEIDPLWIEQFVEQFIDKHGREPSDEEIEYHFRNAEITAAEALEDDK